jgi:hypothetical protein
MNITGVCFSLGRVSMRIARAYAYDFPGYGYDAF